MCAGLVTHQSPYLSSFGNPLSNRLLVARLLERAMTEQEASKIIIRMCATSRCTVTSMFLLTPYSATLALPSTASSLRRDAEVVKEKLS
jgi:hypothetical protein